MADQAARQDPNQFPALIGHSGTAGTAETRRVVVSDEGRLYVGGDLVDTLQELVQRLAPLGAAMSSGAPALRSTVMSGSVVVTVGTVTSSTLLTSAGVINGFSTYKQGLENLVAITANINNVVIS